MALNGPYSLGRTMKIKFKKQQFLKFGNITPVAKEHAAMCSLCPFFNSTLVIDDL